MSDLVALLLYLAGLGPDPYAPPIPPPPPDAGTVHTNGGGIPTHPPTPTDPSN